VLLTPNALVINPVSVTKGPMQINGTTYSQTITVQNLGTTTIGGPISVALDALTPGVTLTNRTGTTVYTGREAYTQTSAPLTCRPEQRRRFSRWSSPTRN
jgi:hypothetical protein